MPLPSPDNDYAAPANMTLNKASWDAAMTSIGVRLRAREALEASFEALIAIGVGQAIAAVQNEIAPTAAQAQAHAAAIEDILDTLTNLGVPAASVLTSPTARFTSDAEMATKAAASGLADLVAEVALKAPLASPDFTGAPTAPTAAPGTNTTQLATTAYVIAVRDALVAAAPGVLDTLDELAAALGDDADFAATMTTALAARLRFDAAQALTAAEIAQARANLALSNSLTVRQTVAAGPVDASGFPTLFPATSGSLSISTQNVDSTHPFVVTAARGFNAYGAVDAVWQETSNVSWSSLPPNSTLYLYVNVANGSRWMTTLAPIYQFGGMPSTVDGQFTFNISEMKGYVGNGSTAIETLLVFVGEVVTNGSSVTSAIAYAYNGRYNSTWIATLPGSGTLTSKNSNLGYDYDVAPSLSLRCMTAEGGYSVGDIVANLGTYTSNPSAMPVTLIFNRKTVAFQLGNNGSSYWEMLNKTTGVRFNPTLGNWAYRIVARRLF